MRRTEGGSVVGTERTIEEKVEGLVVFGSLILSFVKGTFHGRNMTDFVYVRRHTRKFCGVRKNESNLVPRGTRGPYGSVLGISLTLGTSKRSLTSGLVVVGILVRKKKKKVVLIRCV